MRSPMMYSPARLIKYAAPVAATALVLAAPSTADAQAAEPLATTPYKVHPNNWISIEVMVKGNGPCDFKVDTGAGRTHAYQSLKDETASRRPTKQSP